MKLQKEYTQFMPEIMDPLKRHGDNARLQFTGHCIGGSLPLLVHLMLLTRKVVSPSTLRPAMTFGPPFVFCGGLKILEELGLDESHIHCVIMHKDIVLRAFSCNYPNHVAAILNLFNSSFRSHPCLIKNVRIIIYQFSHNTHSYIIWACGTIIIHKNLMNINYGGLMSHFLDHLFSLDFFRNLCTHHWVKYSFSNPMRRHLFHIPYSLQEMPYMPLTILVVDVFLEPSSINHTPLKRYVIQKHMVQNVQF